MRKRQRLAPRDVRVVLGFRLSISGNIKISGTLTTSGVHFVQSRCLFALNSLCRADTKQLLDEVEQNIVICQWRLICETLTNHDILLNLVQYLFYHSTRSFRVQFAILFPGFVVELSL